MSDYDDDYDDEPDGNTVTAAAARDVLEYIARSIVADPDALAIDVDDSRDPVRLNVVAAENDMGRLIGRRGRVANAIRTVVRAAAAADDTQVDVEFDDR